MNSIENQQEVAKMETLPREISLDILSRLPITSILRFKCVCKAWNSLTQDPNLPFLHQSRATKNNPLSLILHSDQILHDQLHLIDNDLYQFETSARELNLHFKYVMPNFDIAGSCNGLLCLSDYQKPDSLHIYNPFTKELLQLRPTNKNFSNQKVVLGFGFHPISKEFKVIRTVYSYPQSRILGLGFIGYGSSDTSIYGSRDHSWRSLGKAAYWLDGSSPTASVNGCVHWLTQAHKYQQYQEIVSFDLAAEVFDKLPGPSCESLKRHWYTLVELRGCLAAVVRSSYNGQVELWVMKEYNVKESWVKEFIIRAHVPVGLNHDMELSSRMQEKRFWKRTVRVVCGLKSGEILLEYWNQVLVSYDPEKDEFKDLCFHGLPSCFETVTLMGSLVSLHG